MGRENQDSRVESVCREVDVGDNPDMKRRKRLVMVSKVVRRGVVEDVYTRG